MSDTIFVWDTTSVADGRYIVHVLASDGPSNSADRALTGERESDPIDVDNTPPTIATGDPRARAPRRRLGVRVRDAQSPIQKVEYSIGGGPWQLVYPVDGLADSPDERYEIPLANEADAARIMIRATDVAAERRRRKAATVQMRRFRCPLAVTPVLVTSRTRVHGQRPGRAECRLARAEAADGVEQPLGVAALRSVIDRQLEQPAVARHRLGQRADELLLARIAQHDGHAAGAN